MQIKQSQVLALAAKRYMQTNREDAVEMFVQMFSDSNLCSDMFKYFKCMCDEMDNSTNIELLDKLVININKEKERMLINEATEEYFKQNKLDDDKTNWKDIFKIIEAHMVAADARPASINDKKKKLERIFKLNKSEYLEDISVFNAAVIVDKLNTIKNKRNTKVNKSNTIGYKTMQTYIITANQLYETAMKEGLIDYNPFKNINFKKSKQQIKESANKCYKPFNSTELKTIFNPKTYFDFNNKDYFYIPLISLLQGMRLNEICQLNVNDIKKHGKDRYFFSIKEDKENNKRTKNNSSNREIPVHCALIDLGFLDWIKQRKKTDRNGKLFKRCYIDSRGYHSRKISKAFNDYLKKLGIKNNTKVFHSFRHCFRVNCANAKISTEMSNALGGWSCKTVGEKYANEFSYNDKMKALKQIKIPELKNLMEFVKNKQCTK